MEVAEVLFKSYLQPPIPYRTYCISKDGVYIGGSPIKGKFPWRSAQGILRGILRAWARDLVEGHDTIQIGAILHRWAKDWTGGNDINGANPAITETSKLERLLSWLREKNADHKVYFRQHYNERDASIMHHLSKEMVEAVSYCLKRISMKPKIQWEVESLPNCVGIYRILLEGGDNCESQAGFTRVK